MTEQNEQQYILHLDEDKHEIAMKTKDLQVFYGEKEAMHKASLQF